MNSPCIGIYDSFDELLFDKCHFYVLTSAKKKPLRYNIHYTAQSSFSTDEERFDMISEWATDIITAHKVDLVGLEGYSYGSKSSRLFQIGENGGLLKHKMFKANINFDIFSPGDIKKHFSGKGNANKELMHETLLNNEGISLGDNSASPISDIIDAYAIIRRTYPNA